MRLSRTATSITKEAITIDAFKEKAFFQVYETPNAYLDQFGTWQKSPDKKSLIHSDGSYISTVGSNYSIVDNQHYFESVINALDDGGIHYVPKNVYVDAGGKRTTMVVTLPQFNLFPHTSEAQDFELRIRNSFDTTLAADTILGFLRLICTNGMTAFDKSFEYRMIHKGNITSKAEGAIELYKQFNGVWTSTKEKIEVMADSFGNKKAVAKYIGDGEVSLNSMFKGERWAKRLQEEWQSQNETTNLWDIYNMMTHIISHNYGSNYSSKINKMEELNREVKKWDSIFEVTRNVPTYVDTYHQEKELMYVNY
jgi:hypothetical protein